MSIPRITRVDRKFPNFEWSSALIEQARALWDEGYSSAEIGRQIGCGKNALVGKAHRLNWPSRPSPINHTGVRQPPKPRRVRAISLPPIAGGETVIATMTAPEPRPMAAAKALVPVVSVPIAPAVPRPSSASAMSRMRTCQWIDGPAGRHARFCGEPTLAGSSWCEAHHARVWQAAPKRVTA